VPDRPERRGLALTAAASLVPFLALALWARFETPAVWEADLLVAAAAREGLTGDALRALTTLGELVLWALIALVLTTVAVLAGRAWAGLLVALSVASDLVAFVVKLLVERSRPEGALVEVLFGTESFAFPSGHVVRATALVAVVAWLVTPHRWRLPVAVGAGAVAGLVMGYSRVALGQHWPTDALGGLLLGIGWFAGTAWFAGNRAIARRMA
jgi:undecaprenyl-diphosphatase